MVVSAAEQDSVLVDQDSVVVPSMEEWAVSSNVTMQIGTATGTGTMATSSTIGSFVFDDGFWFGLDPWYYPYDDYYA